MRERNIPGLLKLDNLLEGSCQFVRHNDLVQSGRWNHPAMKVLTEGGEWEMYRQQHNMYTPQTLNPHNMQNITEENPHIHLRFYFFSNTLSFILTSKLIHKVKV